MNGSYLIRMGQLVAFFAILRLLSCDLHTKCNFRFFTVRRTFRYIKPVQTFKAPFLPRHFAIKLLFCDRILSVGLALLSNTTHKVLEFRLCLGVSILCDGDLITVQHCKEVLSYSGNELKIYDEASV